MLKYWLIAFLLLITNISYAQYSTDSVSYGEVKEFNQELYRYFLYKRDKTDNSFLRIKKINYSAGFLLLHNYHYHHYTWLSIAATSTGMVGTSAFICGGTIIYKISWRRKLKYKKIN